MKIVLRDGTHEVGVFEKADALVLLFHNEEGVFYFLIGPKNLVDATFVQGCLGVLSLVPRDTDTREEMRSLLDSYCTEKNTPFIKALVPGQTQQTNSAVQYKGVNISVSGSGNNPFVMSGMKDALIFISMNGVIKTWSVGWGLEKRELMFLGAELLFGQDVGDALREIIYVKEIMLPDGWEVTIDSASIMRDMVWTMRANPAITEGIILTSEMWNTLTQEQARKGNAPRSLN